MLGAACEASRLTRVKYICWLLWNNNLSLEYA